MEDYIFHEDLPEEGSTFAFEQSLFNRDYFRFLQSKKDWVSFFVTNSKGNIFAIIHFHIEKGVASSPYKSPFGSIEYSRLLSAITLFKFIEFFSQRLRMIGAHSILIKNSPSDYQSDQNVLLTSFLQATGFMVKDCEIASIIHISNKNYKTYLNKFERTKLKKALALGLHLKQISLDQFSLIYEFISSCRKQKGYSLSMTLSDLKNTIDNFKESFFFFAVYHNEIIVAASISIRVKQNILYDFYHDHLSEYDHVSPIVLLVEGLYQFCQQNEIDMLDLGTSTVEGKPNFGLLDFKLRLGAKPTTKFAFEKILN